MEHDKKINLAHLLRRAKNSEHVTFGMSVTTYLAPRVASIPGLNHSWTKYSTIFFEEEGIGFPQYVSED
jgi:hypothetical protein